MSDTTFRRPIRWNFSAKSDKGKVREVNEDAIYVGERIGLWAVADGLGGHKVGDVASNIIVESFQSLEIDHAEGDQESGPPESLNSAVESVEDKIIEANNRILEYTDLMFDCATMGSTVVSLCVRDRVGVCCWVGDSRLYRFRSNKLLQLSRDHSQVEEWVQQGLLSREEGENHPQANVITRAVGVEDNIYVDMNVFSVQIGDTFLLCSDGLYNSVPQSDIERCLQQIEPEACANELLEISLANGAQDNVSLIVLKGEPGRVDSCERTT